MTDRRPTLSARLIALLLFLWLPGTLWSATPLQDETLVIATRHAPPFAIKTEDGWTGITIELVRRIAERRGFSYELREMGLEEMLEAVAALARSSNWHDIRNPVNSFALLMHGILLKSSVGGSA